MAHYGVMGSAATFTTMRGHPAPTSRTARAATCGVHALRRQPALASQNAQIPDHFSRHDQSRHGRDKRQTSRHCSAAVQIVLT